jgi:ABC-type branched-subunit amino acid transport system ATPase component
MSKKIAIARVEIQNYRSCLRTVFEPMPDLSTLIGVNASGKSNILNALLLLKKLGRPGRHAEYERFMMNDSKLRITFSVGDKSLFYRASLRYSTDERNRDDVFASQERWNFKEFTGKDVWSEVPISFWRREMDYHMIGSGQFIVRDNYGRLLRYPTRELATLQKTQPILSEVAAFINSMTYYSASQFTDPSRCPSSFEIDDEGALRRSAVRVHEHTQFVYDLYLAYKKGTSDYDQFLSLVGKNGVNLVESVKFKEVRAPSRAVEVRSGGRLIKRVRETLVVIPSFVIRKTRLSPNQLSEGTFKTLAILFYLITDQSKVLLLEEPEVCVHHGLLASIVELVKTYSRKKQIVVSTHSDFVLDMLEPSNVFLVENLPDRGTVVKHVPLALSAANYRALKEYLKVSGNLGEFWRHGGFDK